MSTNWHEVRRAESPRDDELRQAAAGKLELGRAMRGTLPATRIHDAALEMLLSLYAALPAGLATSPLLAEATLPEASPARWLVALAAEDLAAACEDAVALSPGGVSRMTATPGSVIRFQRELLGWAHH